MRIFVALVCMQPILAGAIDIRYCGAPARDLDGTIHRSVQKISEFKRAHPCPANGINKGACPGWAIDHVIPLVCGGCDDIFNMQWLPNKIKSAAGIYPKDRWEQHVYCSAGK
ncbi:HNHc domain containing protein [uncultured Caudovirales phage]|uniref:HNHc domain containing protein n=1 Tax=uncultured Caudovirales phage TaxID=2100421 RepID=A0A6J5SEI8_9CAUD|nr:HNHc domain containing protein [uncultured Caudovirales phage]CAB4176743.1 HNHc domain containing protein [uncultured Caudovirales phage]CAB4183456.1 HNHc domain containing protein [uncultured Caudovirales phage]CAB4197750.1 HNHc domain containing protein [uncultured Caudovirales phage]CAB4212268.1 HNHc domain containing protein [uncultured Caudovirales phage]